MKTSRRILVVLLAAALPACTGAPSSNEGGAAPPLTDGGPGEGGDAQGGPTGPDGGNPGGDRNGGGAGAGDGGLDGGGGAVGRTDADGTGSGDGASGTDSGAPGGDAASDRADAARLACETAKPPSEGLKLWLKAGEGLGMRGDRVASWVDQAGGAPAAQSDEARQPRLVPAALNGRPILRFENGNQGLSRDVVIGGLSAVTIAFVNATPTLWRAAVEWCQHENCDPGRPLGPRAVTETGCSGTYQKVLWWNGTKSWGGVYLSPKQEEVAFRFGNGESTYSPNPCSIAHDPLVSWMRPKPIGSAFSSTVAIHDRLVNFVYVHGEKVLEVPVPGGKTAPIDAASRLDIGNGFGWIDDRNRGGDVAEVLVYARALPEAERLQLEAYLACSLFPERVKP